MSLRKITQEEEMNIPLFPSHEQAKDYFLAEYGSENFVYKMTKEGAGELLHTYTLIVDHDAYKAGQAKLARFEMITGPEFTDSFQTIQITESGKVFIIR